MTSQKNCYKLSNGVEIPCLGFGTWQAPDGETAVQAVRCALDAGYTHIDTAQAYGNEESVGKAIRLSGVPRKDLFITTKLWNSNHSYELTIRRQDMSRYVLERSEKTAQTPYGPVRMKCASGMGVERAKAEYDDLARLASENNVSLDTIRKAIQE